MDTTDMTPFPTLDSAPTTSEGHAHAMSTLCNPCDPIFQLDYEGPLYTEINIPLPRIPRSYQPPTSSASTTSKTSTPTSTATDRPRGRTLTLSRFRPRSSSSATSTSTCPSSRPRSSSTTARHSADNPRPRKDTVKSREVNAIMDLRHPSKKLGRNGVIDALAVVPAVLVLSAELFTPGSEEQAKGGGRKDSGVGRWEDGIR